ncbi:DUF1634 domain-containing protein [Acinetobacter pollinis]|uniref:DUF1634 domain-containing protein n=1 Tax=Acinetobacter pollinis TaxID=2605270 RepID=UPI0018C22A74|nr:DUF1634 domain-containing protein [Acinetobacter pollinis]MBF7691849.1 DUF1634 domain-containing protein [Acinetobacter pollinis]MBF7699954.1 DUF1634 domain-containing protein [Acinetobacter pollinis]
MTILIVFLGIYIGFYFLFLLNHKKQKPSFAWVYKYPKGFKLISITLFLLSFYLLVLRYGISVAFVSWWVFATPTILLLILLNNPMRAKSPK